MVSYFKQCAEDFIYNSCKLEDQQQDHIALNLSYRDIGMCNVTLRTYTLMEMGFRMINLVFDISVLYTTQICKVKEIKTSTKKGLQMPLKSELSRYVHIYQQHHQCHTLCFGLDHISTNALHLSSVIHVTGDVVLTRFARTPSKYFFFSLCLI